ncbi:MAG: O-antigen ligase family protein [Terriglobales bacterium]
MTRWNDGFHVALIIAVCAIITGLLVADRPGYFTNMQYLGGLLLLEALAVVMWKYDQRFFPVLILVFLFAGTDVPMAGIWRAVRWVVLGAGALAGMVIYLKNYSFSARLIHWIALSCVVAAATSAEVSSFPTQPLLKAASLFLLFLYGTFGARLAIIGREKEFFKGLLWGCEALIYFVALQYFVLHRQFFGNPNSLGAVMGIVAVPLMLWGISVAEKLRTQRRRMFALLLSMILLLTSYARASIVAAAISCILFCILLRTYRTLIKGLAIALLMATVVSYVVPLPNSPDAATTLRSRFLFKGKEKGGALNSRRSVWDTTISSIEQNPWFGTGFGTAFSAFDTDADQVANFGSTSITTHEHGNSYLAILEGVGLVGAVPFFCLVILTVVNIVRVLRYLWRTRDVFSAAVPVALVLMAGLMHAMFEDWLFAVGYYTCVFFWAFGFMLVDLVPLTSQVHHQPDFPQMHAPQESVLVPSVP